MATKRRTIRRGIRSNRLTPEVIAAWMACDYRALHCALGLQPHEPSPLPREIGALGCSEEDLARVAPDSPRLWDKALPRSLELQRRLLALAGWPDCREAYETNLREAEEW